MFGLSEEIMTREKRAVVEANALLQLPTISESYLKKVQAVYPEITQTKVDKVLSQFTLPAGWKLAIDPKDRYGRNTIITDADGKEVGSFFLTNTGYDYYGNTQFTEVKEYE